MIEGREVFCSNCKYFKERNEEDGERCLHNSNYRYRKNYKYSEKLEISNPQNINSDNSCLNFHGKFFYRMFHKTEKQKKLAELKRL